MEEIIIPINLIKETKLKGNKLLLLSIIIKETKEKGKMSYSLSKLAKILHTTKESVYNSLMSLVQKGYVEREVYVINKVRYVDYISKYEI